MRLKAFQKKKKVSSQSGAVLLFALGVMLILFIIGMRFLSVTASRQMVSNNQKDSLQAQLIAEAGIADALHELEKDRNWRAGFGNKVFAGGTYSVSIKGSISADVVELTSQSSFKNCGKSIYVNVTLPPQNGEVTVWATAEGTGPNEWHDRPRCYDSISGPNGQFAKHKIAESGENEMTLTGPRQEKIQVKITKLEIVFYGYLDKKLIDDYQMIRWETPKTGENGTYHNLGQAELSDIVGWGNEDYVYVDVTADAPSGGWKWSHFSENSDLQLRFESVQVHGRDPVTLFVDCAGFRISW